jgi:glyoxylase-like metal-dependent hydrolase (beta-lactamase superfamily II)
MLVGQGGNLGVSYGPNGTLLIDDQFAPLSDKILAALAKLESAPLRYVVNTHWHGDHIGGNLNMASAGAAIVAHDNVRVRMSQDQFSAALGRKSPASPAQALPVISFARDVTFHFNGQVIHVVHVDPAHTDGDSLIFFEGKNVVHMGDTYFNGFYPFVDFSTGGEPRGMVAAVDLVLARIDDETQIIPGHGPLSDRLALLAYREMLNTNCDRIAAAIATGKSVEEVVAMKPTADFDAKWGKGFLAPDQFVQILYRGLVD